MRQTLAEQEKTAEALFKEAFRRHPKASRTAVLWCKWRDIKARLIAQQSKDRAA